MSKKQIEQWRWIPGYENKYQVSDQGRVLSFRVYPWGVILRGDPTRFGHIRVSITDVGKSTPTMVHRLVLKAFVGEPEPDQILCRHLNGIPYDNRLENLRWGTSRDNALDRVKHGMEKRLILIKEEDLTKEKIAAIRHRTVQYDKTIADVALEFGVHPRTVRHLTRGDIAACDFDTAHDILCWYIKGKTQKQLARRYGISAPTVSHIINRKGAYADLGGPTVERQHRKGGPKGITHAEAVEIRTAYAEDRANTITVLGERYSVNAATIGIITQSQGKWSSFGAPVKRPLLISVNEAQLIHDQYHRDYPNLMDLAEQYSTSFYTIKDIVGRQGEYTELQPHSGPVRTSRWIEREQAEQIRQAYQEDPDVTLADLAQLHHSSIGTINAIMLAKGRYSYFDSQIKKQNKKRPPAVSLDLAQKMLDQYMTGKFIQKQLAQQYGCSGGTVKKILGRKGCYACLETSP